MEIKVKDRKFAYGYTEFETLMRVWRLELLFIAGTAILEGGLGVS